MTALRSFLLHDQRNTVCPCLPDCRVEGEAPASAANASSVGNRSRQSPISARSVAARTIPDRGRLANIFWSGCASKSFRICASIRAISSDSVSMVATKPIVISPRASASTPSRPGAARSNLALSR